MARISEASRFMREMPIQFKTRADGDNLYIEGYFSVFKKTYEKWYGDKEQIAPGAFARAIREDDVRALVNHDTTLVLGRNTSGTLELREDETGLFGSILINPKDQDAMNAYSRVERGDVNQCSFGFDIISMESELMEDDCWMDRITEVKLYEVSICTFPAYEDTSVQARDKESCEAHRAELIEKRNQSWKESMLKKLKGES